MTISWLLLRAVAPPGGEAWLGARERSVLHGLTVPKRRSEWKAGRLVAKRLLAARFEIESLAHIEILAAEDGAPEAFIDGRKLNASISISHRDDAAACVVASDARVGCDLEAIEPRTSRFVRDFFTDLERASAERMTGALRDLHVALTWSAKESVLKVLRTGLRRDTRSVEIEIDEAASTPPGWHRFTGTVRPEGLHLGGWWREVEDLVFTVGCDDRSLHIAGHDEEWQLAK
jgi:4'-phosphopantetheinyl transferase